MTDNRRPAYEHLELTVPEEEVRPTRSGCALGVALGIGTWLVILALGWLVWEAIR